MPVDGGETERGARPVVEAERAGGYLHVTIPASAPRLLRDAIRNLGRPDPRDRDLVVVPAFRAEALGRLSDRYGYDLAVEEAPVAPTSEGLRQVNVRLDGGRTIVEHPAGPDREFPAAAAEAMRGCAFRVLPGRWLAMKHQTQVLVARLQRAGFEVLAPEGADDLGLAGVRTDTGVGVRVTYERDPSARGRGRREAPVFLRVDTRDATSRALARRFLRRMRREGQVRVHARGHNHLWVAPDSSAFQAIRREGEEAGFRFERGDLEGRPLRGTPVYADVGCLPSRFHVPPPKEGDPEDGGREDAIALIRGTPGAEPDEARDHWLIPSTRTLRVVEELRDLGARVMMRRLAPKRVTLRDWKEDLPIDHTGARPAPRRWEPRLHEDPIPGIRPDVRLDPHQREMVAFIRDTGFRAYVADEMGLGKTLSVIAACLTTPERVLVVCPPSARTDVWEREIRKWTTVDVRVILPGDDPAAVAEGDRGEKFTVLGYHGLEKFMPALSKIEFGVAVMDEAHYTRNKRARRTALAHAWLSGVPKRVLMSGSPVMNDPGEIRKQLEFLYPGEWSDEAWFRERFVEPWRNGTPAVQEKILEKLGEYFEGVMLRREKRHVLPDLPDKQFHVHRAPLPADAREAYDAAEAVFTEYVEDHEDEAMGRAFGQTAAKLETLKQTALVGKLPRALDLLHGLLDAGEKVVVFTRYVDAVKSLARELAHHGAVTYYGATRHQDRTRAVESFREDPDTRVFVGQIHAAGTGITLTAARHVVFLDLDWNPENHRQAMDRVHRKGQTQEVEVHFVIAEDTVDEDIAEILEKKAHMTSYLLDGRAGGLGLVTHGDAIEERELKRDVALNVLRRTRRAMAETG